MRKLFILLFMLVIPTADARQNVSSKQAYLAELKTIGKEFSNNFYPNYAKIYTLPEKHFITKLDSAREVFNAVLIKHISQLDDHYIKAQQKEISYYFDKLLIDYPRNHDIYVGNTFSNPSAILKRLQQNLSDFDDPALLTNTDFTNYVRAFLSLQINLELRKNSNKYHDNQQLNVAWKLIPKFMANRDCKEFWFSEYLYDHIENNGIKNIETIYQNFKSTCKTASYLNKVALAYSADSIGRQGHLTKTYKNVGPVDLDLHIFLPKNIIKDTKRPVIIYFHGGSWSEGKPDWFFNSCEHYSEKGWVAVAVEYRTYGRHGTLPFDAVMDAKSAIRWIRAHANEFNIDTSKIVASGNSAGGHLILATALANKWNEKTDDLKFGAVPTVLMVNSGVYDLTDQTTAWIRKDLKDKTMAEQISPNFLVKKDFPNTLIIHGTNDKNVPYASAKKFVDDMKKAGAANIQFESLNGAGHFIWYDEKYSSEVSKIRSEFLTKLGY